MRCSAGCRASPQSGGQVRRRRRASRARPGDRGRCCGGPRGGARAPRAPRRAVRGDVVGYGFRPARPVPRPDGGRAGGGRPPRGTQSRRAKGAADGCRHSRPGACEFSETPRARDPRGRPRARPAGATWPTRSRSARRRSHPSRAAIATKRDSCCSLGRRAAIHHSKCAATPAPAAAATRGAVQASAPPMCRCARRRSIVASRCVRRDSLSDSGQSNPTRAPAGNENPHAVPGSVTPLLWPSSRPSTPTAQSDASR